MEVAWRYRPVERFVYNARKRAGKPGGAKILARAPRQTAGRRPRPDVVHSSLYLPEAVYEALRESAFKERCKIHDLVMQGIEMALKKRGYPSVEELKAGKKR
jgi:hypothetical protein